MFNYVLVYIIIHIILYIILYYTLLFFLLFLSFPILLLFFISIFYPLQSFSFILYVSGLPHGYLYTHPIFHPKTIRPRMFYRSGWLRCDVFKCIGFCFMFGAYRVYVLRIDVWCYYYIILYIIYYYTYTYILYIIILYYIITIIIYYTILFCSSFSIFLDPFLPILSSLPPIFLPSSFKVYVSAFGYPYLY